MQTKKVQTGFVSFTTACLLSCILSLSLINSVSDTAIEVMLCTLILNLAERESATGENVCNLQPFPTIFLQQRSISVKALGVGHQWL